MIRNKEAFTFEIADSSVKMVYNNQCVIFNTFNCPSRHKFNRFRTTIINSPKTKYNTINDVFGLARACEVRATGATMPIIVYKNIAY